MIESEELTKFGDEIIANFKQFVGDAWEKIGKEDMDLLKALARDAAMLHFKNLINQDPKLDVEIQIVNASLLNLGLAHYFPVKKTFVSLFWQSVERAATMLVSALVTAAIAAV